MRRFAAVNAALFAALVAITSLVAAARSRSFTPPPSPQLLQGGLAKAFETHYDAVFPVRTFGVNLWAAIDYLLFDEGRPGVVLGRDGWLYTDEEFLLPDGHARALQDNLALIAGVHQWLAERQVHLILALVPAKARVYPEHLGERAPPDAQAALYAEAQGAIRDAGIPSPPLLDVLRSAKASGPSFLRTDTHWTPEGAAYAARAVAAQAATVPLPQRGAIAYRSEQLPAMPYRGDLLGFLPLDPYFAGLLPAQELLAEARTEALGGNSASGLLDDAPAPEIALVGTSYSAHARYNFAGALRQALSADVANYAREGQGPLQPMLDYLTGADFRLHPPRLVIWEVPERYLLQAYVPPSESLRQLGGLQPGVAHATPVPAATRP